MANRRPKKFSREKKEQLAKESGLKPRQVQKREDHYTLKQIFKDLKDETTVAKKISLIEELLGELIDEVGKRTV